MKMGPKWKKVIIDYDNLYIPIFKVQDPLSNFFWFRRKSSFMFGVAPSTGPTGTTVSSMLCWQTCKIVAIDATIGFDLKKSCKYKPI